MSVDYFTNVDVSFVQGVLSSGEFWKKFSTIRTSGDGHCLVYSIIDSLKKQLNLSYDYCYVLDVIRSETIDNAFSYMQLLNIDNVISLHRLLCAYVDGKNFDTPLGDCLPMILSNALHINIVVIHKTTDSVNPIFVVPRISSSHFVYIYKFGDHYEGIETNCFDPVVGIQTFSMCSNNNSAAYLETTQASPVCSISSGCSERPPGEVATCNNIIPKISSDGTHCLTRKPGITAWNIYGLAVHKLEANESFLRKSMVIVMTETWSRGNLARDIFPGYDYLDFPRPNQHKDAPRGAGGIGIFIKEEFLDHIKIYKSYKDIIVWVKFCKKYFGLSNDLLLGVVYCYPEYSSCITEDMYAVLFEQMSYIPSHFDKLMCGDWNARIGSCPDWCIDSFHFGSEGEISNFPQLRDDSNSNDEEAWLFLKYLESQGCLERTSQDAIPTPNNYGRSFLEFLKVFGMFIANGRLGRDKGVGSLTFISNNRGTSIVDYLVGTPKTIMLIENFGIETKLPESDHMPITFTLNCTFFSESNELAHKSNWFNQFSYHWKSDRLNEISAFLCDDKSKPFYNEYVDSIACNSDCNTVASKFHQYFSQACNRLFPLKVINCAKINKKPVWLDKELQMKRAEAIKAGERVSNIYDREILRAKSREYRSLRQLKERNFKVKSIKEVEYTMHHDRSNLWPIIKKLSYKQDSRNIPTRNEFYNFFYSLSNPPPNELFDYSYEAKAIQYLNSQNNFIPYTVYSNESDMINRNFTVAEVEAAIDYLKNGKSAGIDCIPPEFLKASKSSISEDLCNIFNYIIEKRDFPSDWTVGLRSAIHKAGVKSSTLNYRGITVLPMFEKLFEILVQKRIEFIDEAFDNSDRYNGGFKKGSRCADNIFILLGLIHRQLSLGLILILILVDFSKAFDRINRAILFYKIKRSGLRGRVIDTLINLYSKTCYRVKHQGKLSEVINERIGVNQGANTSPLLFNKYLIDLKDYLDSSTGVCTLEEIIVHMLWADDLFMVSTVPTDAQKQLDDLSSYTAPNQLIANDIKTKYMVFGKSDTFTLRLNGKRIKRVKSSKCLGFIVNSVQTPNGDIFRENPDYLKDKARKSVFSFLNRVKKIGNASPKCMFNLYECLTQPILLYGSDLWGISKSSTCSVDLLLNWFLRIILGVKQGTCVPMLLGESGVYPPSVYCHINVILYYIRLNNLPLGSVVKSVFLDVKDSFSSNNNWCYNVNSLALEYGLNIDNLQFNNETKNIIKTAVKEKFVSDWRAKMNDRPGLKLYKLFKHEFRYEPYLDNVKNTNLRKVFTRLRTNSHFLEIERGRYVNKNECDRLCSLCKTVENEFHFVMVCPLYEDLRYDFLSEIYYMFPFLQQYSLYEQFLFFMGFDDCNLHCIFSKFISNAFNVRSGVGLTLPSVGDLCRSPGDGGGQPHT